MNNQETNKIVLETTLAFPSPQTLDEALASLGLEFSAEQIERLDRYRAALWKWNERLNLTRHTDLEKFAHRDVYDAMMLERLLGPGEDVLDVGTGGGVPGVILAIARPDLSVTLSESVAKKAKAVAAIVGELDLPVAVEHARAESLLETRRFDSLVARGVAPLHRILTWFEPRWDAIGQLFLIKGKNWTAERSDARSRGLLRDLELRRLTTYTTPRTDNISVILRVSPKED